MFEIVYGGAGVECGGYEEVCGEGAGGSEERGGEVILEVLGV